MFRLAHFSDPHLAGWAHPGPASLLSKRFVGYLSWRFRRQRIHLTRILDALTADLKAAKPDHTVITGDLVNISLPDEFARATRWLETIGTPQDLTVIPGNHDAYIALPWQNTIGQWARYMGDERGNETEAASGPDSFPFVKVRGNIALIGLSTARPMPFKSAQGWLGPEQIERLRERLNELKQRDLFRIVLIHHPPFTEPGYERKQLLDVVAFRDAIADAGAELVLHGHTHRSSLNSIPVPGGSAPVIGVASASARAWHGKDPARYHVYAIDRTEDGWRLDVDVRSLDEETNRFSTTGAFHLQLPMSGQGSAPTLPRAA